MKIAIIALHFKPDRSTGATRPENWAVWLAEEHDVTVVTKERIDGLVDETTRYKVVRAKSFFIRLIDLFNLYRIERKNKQQRELYNNPLNVRKCSITDNISGIFRYRMPCLYDFWFISALKKLYKIRPNLIIATHSPYIDLVIAYVYCLFNHKTKLVVDFRDFWSNSTNTNGVIIFRLIEKWLENKILARSAVVTSVSKAYCVFFKDRGAKNVALIYNSSIHSYRKSTCRAPLYVNNFSSNMINVTFTGTFYSTLQDPTPLFLLLNRLDKENLINPNMLRVNVASYNPGCLLDMAIEYGVNKYFNYLGHIPREAANDLQNNSDFLLLFDFYSSGVLTSKVFDYLITDKPILFVSHDENSELCELVKHHGRLINIDSFCNLVCCNGNMQLSIKREAVDYSVVAKQQLFDVIKNINVSTI